MVDREHIRRVYIQTPIISPDELSELRMQLAEARSARDDLQDHLQNVLRTRNEWRDRATERTECNLLRERV